MGEREGEEEERAVDVNTQRRLHSRTERNAAWLHLAFFAAQAEHAVEHAVGGAVNKACWDEAAAALPASACCPRADVTLLKHSSSLSLQVTDAVHLQQARAQEEAERGMFTAGLQR